MATPYLFELPDSEKVELFQAAEQETAPCRRSTVTGHEFLANASFMLNDAEFNAYPIHLLVVYAHGKRRNNCRHGPCPASMIPPSGPSDNQKPVVPCEKVHEDP